MKAKIEKRKSSYMLVIYDFGSLQKEAKLTKMHFVKNTRQKDSFGGCQNVDFTSWAVHHSEEASLYIFKISMSEKSERLYFSVAQKNSYNLALLRPRILKGKKFIHLIIEAPS